MTELISLIIIVAVIWVIFWILEKVTMPEPLNMIVKVAVVIIAVVYLVQRFLM